MVNGIVDTAFKFSQSSLYLLLYLLAKESEVVFDNLFVFDVSWLAFLTSFKSVEVNGEIPSLLF